MHNYLFFLRHSRAFCPLIFFIFVDYFWPRIPIRPIIFVFYFNTFVYGIWSRCILFRFLERKFDIRSGVMDWNASCIPLLQYACLFFTLILSFTGFGAAVFYSDFWKENSTLGVGLWIGMLLVSLYISTLVKKLTDALEYADVSQKNLTVALKSAEQANQAKRRFISSVSHEMRTPLNAIIGMGNLVQHTKLDEEQATMVHTINNASQMMLSLIEDVLDFSKIEAGKIIIENTEFRLRTLVHSTADIFKHQAYEKGLTFNVLIQPEAPNFLVGDPKHLRQVLVNLIGNAVKFTEAGYVSLNVLLVKESVDNAEIRFEIIDTGIGITNEAQGRIFESFF